MNSILFLLPLTVPLAVYLKQRNKKTKNRFLNFEYDNLTIVGELAIYRDAHFDDGTQYHSVVIDMCNGVANGFDEHVNKIESFNLQFN
jgi:hypothetical protein